MTKYRKGALVAHITQIELECSILGELNGAIDAAIRRSDAKLYAAVRMPLIKRCFELDVFIFCND